MVRPARFERVTFGSGNQRSIQLSYGRTAFTPILYHSYLCYNEIMIYVATPGRYTEIDGYASCLAYAELLNQRSKPARTYLAAEPNYSVPDFLRIRELENFTLDFKPDDEAIILDISIPEVINQYFPDNQILEIIDHHPGFESYWHERIGDKAIIEKIGAVATSIYEWWGECWDYAKMSPAIARLLLAAILDNTLNFNAIITTDRDRTAAEHLAKLANTTVADFATEYFAAVSKTIVSNLASSIQNDHKPFHIPKLNLDIECAQLTLWDGKVLENCTADIYHEMNNLGENWLCSILSISDCCNYILTNNSDVASYLSQVLGLQSRDDWFVSDHLWLRKEIFAKLLEN